MKMGMAGHAASTSTHPLFRACSGKPIPPRSSRKNTRLWKTHSSKTTSTSDTSETLLTLPSSGASISIETVPSIDEIVQSEWDACAYPQDERAEKVPFLKHSFLAALERSKSVCRDEGWLPLHLVVKSENDGKLLGCSPLYMKGHSMGEYVFDQGWAQAFQRAGGSYYPKLQSAVPFTPVTGSRLLVRGGLDEDDRKIVSSALARGLIACCHQYNVSSAHVTFCRGEEMATFRELGYMPRLGMQYHWENRRRGTEEKYASFKEFEMDLKQSRRKNVRQERKRPAKDGLRVFRATGDDIKPDQMADFYEMYIAQTEKKWGRDYLRREFFDEIYETMRDDIMFVFAEQEGTGRLVAGAINFIGSHALYGRNWGCLPPESAAGDANLSKLFRSMGVDTGAQMSGGFKHLHFECCYYQAIEAAIELGLDRVEAGAQGEHKISRGYLPVETHSAHYVADLSFQSAVSEFLGRERREMMEVMEVLTASESPFKT